MTLPNTTILLVEDDENDVLFMKTTFQEVGVKEPLAVVGNGKEAMAYLGGTGRFADCKKHPRPAMVLLDLKLPHVMGLDVLKWIRSRPELRSLIVIVLTSSANPADINTAYELGANAYLVKPTSYDQLRVLTQALRDFWLIHNHAPGAAEA